MIVKGCCHKILQQLHGPTNLRELDGNEFIVDCEHCKANWFMEWKACVFCSRARLNIDRAVLITITDMHKGHQINGPHIVHQYAHLLSIINNSSDADLFSLVLEKDFSLAQTLKLTQKSTWFHILLHCKYNNVAVMRILRFCYRK